MTELNRTPRAVSADAAVMTRETGGDAVMMLVLALVFLPIVGVHVAFAFGSPPVAIERTAAMR